jgi:hypothetical protein
MGRFKARGVDEGYTDGNGEAISPVQILCDEPADEWCKMRPIGEEEGEDSHVEAALMNEV